MRRQISDRMKERKRCFWGEPVSEVIVHSLRCRAVFLSGFYQWTFQALSLKMHMVHLNTVIIKCFEVICPITRQCFIVEHKWWETKHDSKEAIQLNKGVLSFFTGKQSESDVASVSVDLGTILTWVAWQMMFASQTLTHLINLIYWKIRTYKPFQLLISSGNLAQGREKVSGCCACLLLENSKNHFWHYNHLTSFNKCGAMMSLRTGRVFIFEETDVQIAPSCSEIKCSPKWDKLHPECPTLE